MFIVEVSLFLLAVLFSMGMYSLNEALDELERDSQPVETNYPHTFNHTL